MKSYVVNEAQSLSNFTDNTCAQASFRLRILLKEGRIKVNGKRVAGDIALAAGDSVQYFLTPKEEAKEAYAVVYEDENVIVADKADGVNSEAVFSSLLEHGQAYFIHRLDRNTAGVLIFAKTAEAQEELLTLFRERRVTKTYLALVVGKMPKQHAVEEAYLVKDEGKAEVKITPDRGEKIITEYEVLSAGEVSLLKITLHTGKTHQIRAHLAYLSHPVAGDEKYGDNAFNRSHHLTRQRLVAKELTLNGEGGALSYLSGKTFVSRYEPKI